jgi:hypothetical protein
MVQATIALFVWQENIPDLFRFKQIPTFLQSILI